MGELLTDLKTRIKNTELKDNLTINRLSSSMFIGNKESHDSLFEASSDDLEAFWEDIEAFKDIFFCISCSKYVSFSRDSGSRGKKIRCKCGDRMY